jgi:hypothetical protein
MAVKLSNTPKRPNNLEFLPSAANSGTRNIASMDEYDAMMADRPVKFMAGQVGYMEHQPEAEYQCQKCTHFFTSTNRSVCEILRLSPEKPIPHHAGCVFWTKNGEEFPLYESSKNN